MAEDQRTMKTMKEASPEVRKAKPENAMHPTIKITGIAFLMGILTRAPAMNTRRKPGSLPWRRSAPRLPRSGYVQQLFARDVEPAGKF